MRTILNCLFGAATLVLLPACPRIEGALGEPAPEISAERWFNHLGQEPTLRNLRGRAVLIEFWATW